MEALCTFSCRGGIAIMFCQVRANKLGFVPVLGPKHGGFDIGVLGVILLFLFYCGEPPTKPCYNLSSFTRKVFGSTANYEITGTMEITIKCFIGGWQRLPPCPDCGEPPSKPCYNLSSFTGKVLGSTANYIHISGTRSITIKCFVGGWESLPPCPVSCGDPIVKPDFRLLKFTSGTLEGDIRYYRCVAPKEMMFETSSSRSCPIVTCQKNGLWTDFTIECRSFQSLGTVISSSSASGIVTSPNYPNSYTITDTPTYGYSIVTTGKSLDFMFHGAFGLGSSSSIIITCDLKNDKSSDTKSFSNTEVLPSPFTCPTGCANVFFGAFSGVGSMAGFNLTWQANL